MYGAKRLIRASTGSSTTAAVNDFIDWTVDPDETPVNNALEQVLMDVNQERDCAAICSVSYLAGSSLVHRSCSQRTTSDLTL